MVLPTPIRRWPGRRTFVAGLAASVIFAIYGSLVPFDLRRVPLDEALRRFDMAMALPLQAFSRSDLIANVLLMVPVACCLMALFRLDRRGLGGTMVASVVTIACGFGFANLLEFMQVFTPDRVVSKSDVLAQTIGAMIGVGTWLVLGQPMVDWLRGASAGHARRAGLDTQWRRVQALLAVYAAGWFILMALPLELTLSPGELVHKYRAGSIVLVPFAGAYESFSDLLWDVIGGALSAAPLGVFAWLTALDLRWRAPRGGALLLGCVIVGAGELVQVFEIHRVADVTDVLIGCTGVAVSVWLAARHLHVAAATPRDARVVAYPARGSSLAALAQTLAWCGVLVFYHWKPFDFTTNSRFIRERVSDLSLMPLAQYVHASTGPQLLMQMLVKGALGVPLGALLARWLGSAFGLRGPSARRFIWIAGLVLALGVLGAIEVGQIFLPDRVADVTDVLVAWCGAASGMALVLNGPLAQQSIAVSGRKYGEGAGTRQTRTVHESRSL
jgi:VanZ family protein